MKPSDLVEADPLYDEYWMLRFLQDTPGLGYGIYRLCEIAENCIREHLKHGTELNAAVSAPHLHEIDVNMHCYVREQFVDWDEDGDPIGDMYNFWNYDSIIRSLQQRCHSVLMLLEHKYNK